MLTNDEQRVLQAYTTRRAAYPDMSDEFCLTVAEGVTLANALLRMYPPDGAVPVTEDRLRAAGFAPTGHDAVSRWFTDPTDTFQVVLQLESGECWIYADGEFSGSLFDPQNMNDVMQYVAKARKAQAAAEPAGAA